MRLALVLALLCACATPVRRELIIERGCLVPDGCMECRDYGAGCVCRCPLEI